MRTNRQVILENVAWLGVVLALPKIMEALYDRSSGPRLALAAARERFAELRHELGDWYAQRHAATLIADLEQTLSTEES